MASTLAQWGVLFREDPSTSTWWLASGKVDSVAFRLEGASVVLCQQACVLEKSGLGAFPFLRMVTFVHISVFTHAFSCTVGFCLCAPPRTLKKKEIEAELVEFNSQFDSCQTMEQSRPSAGNMGQPESKDTGIPLLQTTCYPLHPKSVEIIDGFFFWT